MKLTRTLIAAATGLAVLAAACGGNDGEDTNAADTRTIEVDMVDVAFEPDTLAVKRGETIRFVFKNSGKVDHDAFIGDADAQADHEDEMRMAGEGDGHDGHGDDEGGITVEPGETGEITHTFTDAGAFEVGCHEPGHYAAGMKIAVTVT